MSIRPMNTMIVMSILPLALGACGESAVVDPEPAGPGLPTVQARAPSASVGYDLPGSDAQLAALHGLQAAFHGALNESDEEAVRSLWAPDAVVWAGAIGCLPCTGPAEITEAFSGSGPFVNGWASLAPSYKTRFEIHGSTAEYGFECVYLTDVAAGESLAGQTVHAHLNATGTMRKVGDRWLFQTFQAGLGSL